ARLGIEWLYQRASRRPRHNPLHLGKKHRPPCCLGVALKPHCRQRQLLHPPNLPNHPPHPKHYTTIIAAGFCRGSLNETLGTRMVPVRQPTEHVWPIPVIDLSLTVDESRSVDPREGQGDGIANCPVPGNYVHGHCHLVRQRSEMGTARHEGGSMATSGPVNDLNQHHPKSESEFQR